MTAISPTLAAEQAVEVRPAAEVDHLWKRVLRSGRVLIGGGILLLILLLSVITLPLTVRQGTRWYYDDQRQDFNRLPPRAVAVSEWFGTDSLGRSILARSLLGGASSLCIGVAHNEINILNVLQVHVVNCISTTTTKA